jgi:hypothetical protein|tara:strand:- start:121 stop:588 length:468 start_codon:yes stop_codon:yes gene_type:complete
MIQLKVRNVDEFSVSNSFYLDVYSKMNKYQTNGRSLCTFTSQFTGKSKTVSLNTGYGDFNSRYVQYGVFTNRDADQENLLTGIIQLGTTDFPLGFYDVTIYNNTDNTNLDPTGLPVIWNGLMNLTGFSSATQSAKYTEYTNNDADTESIYLTNPL